MKTIVDELRNDENKHKFFAYVGSIFGEIDESREPWVQMGGSFADDLAANFSVLSEVDLEDAAEDELSEVSDWFLDVHPAYSHKKGWYYQSGNIWYTALECDEEVFHAVGE